MKMSYIIIGTSLIIVGVGIYYLIKKAKESGSYKVDYKETDTIKLSDIGEWLKTLDVDMEDFGKSRRIFVIKNIMNSSSGLKLSEDITAKLANSASKVVLAFVLSDMNCNTKNAIVVIGNSIDNKFNAMLRNEVTEIKMR